MSDPPSGASGTALQLAHVHTSTYDHGSRTTDTCARATVICHIAASPYVHSTLRALQGVLELVNLSLDPGELHRVRVQALAPPRLEDVVRQG